MPDTASPVLPETPRLRKDLLRLLAVTVVAAVMGILHNLVRQPGLAWSYASREKRLAAELQALGAEAGAGKSGGSAAFPRVELRELMEAVKTGNVRIIDARSPLFFRAGHLPGAVNLPRQDFRAAYARVQTVLEADRNRRLVVYCQGESCQDSDLVAAALQALGFEDVSVFAGGWKAWQAAGNPVETGTGS